MSIKPLLFNTDMVRAILDGRKTVTRRLPSKRLEEKWWEYDEWASDTCAGFAIDGIPCDRTYEKEFYEQFPPYQIGDILYVRETWARLVTAKDGEMQSERYVYKSTDEYPFGESGYIVKFRWKPSIHMPKEAARIWLKVTDVRVERLKEVTEEQAAKEGAIDNRGFIHSPDNEYDEIHTAREHFEKIWDSTIPKQDLNQYGWSANPWVWVIEFDRCEKPETE